MNNPTTAAAPDKQVRDRIIVAVDVGTAAEARSILDELRGHVAAFKVGLQLFTGAGPAIVRTFTEAGAKVFLDLKFHDIPNTVARASVEAARLGVWMFNVHASGGSEMMRRTADEMTDACVRERLVRPLILGVTVLTSSDSTVTEETGITSTIDERVTLLARLASYSGLDGVVASGLEVNVVRKAVPEPKFLVVTPGIRPSFATADDQKRVTNVRGAFANGSDYVVIGRPITQAPDRLAAVERMVAEAGTDI